LASPGDTRRLEALGVGDRFSGDSVDIYINQSCNLTCTTCFLGDNYFANPYDMDIQTFAEIVRWAVDQGVYDVALLGGEPTLHPALEEMISLARKSGVTRIRLVTNGTAPFRRYLKHASDFPDVVYLSLDGTTDLHNDEIRGKGTHAQVLRAIELLDAHQIEYTLTSTLSLASSSRVANLIDMAEETGCSTLNIHWLSPTGRAALHPHLTVPVEHWLPVVDFVSRYVPTRPDFSVRIQQAFASQGDEAARHCAVRENQNLQFFPDGSVYACGLAVSIPELRGRRWSGSRPELVDTERNELTICAVPQDGCPVRMAGAVSVPSDSLHTSDTIPVCIYNRIADASH